MGYLRMVSQYDLLTGLSKDTQTNTMHFAYNGDREDACSDIASEWAQFLAVIDGSMDDSIFDPDIRMTFFDMEEPEPRVPVFNSTFGATYATTGVSLPLECSMVVSFAGPVVSGPGQGRTRGRIYLPTYVQSATVVSGQTVRWEPATLAGHMAAFQDFAQDLLALASPCALQVYSPTRRAGGATLAASMTAVTRGWVDNEPDTQRRRGTENGTKSTFVV